MSTTFDRICELVGSRSGTLGWNIAAAKTMNTKTRTRLIKEGDYLAEVDVTLLYDIEPWAPHLSKEDALKLDRVKLALRAGDLDAAARDARIYEVVPRAIAGHA